MITYVTQSNSFDFTNYILSLFCFRVYNFRMECNKDKTLWNEDLFFLKNFKIVLCSILKIMLCIKITEIGRYP